MPALNHTISEQEEGPVTTERDCYGRLCARRIYRRDFLKVAVAAAGAGLLAAGCNTSQEPTAAPASEPTATPISEPTASPTIPPTPKSTAIPTYSADDFSRMAYCGIRCWAACPERAYPTNCEGCKSEGGKLGPFCEVCALRKCASEKEVLTCAHCDEYPLCKVDTWTRYPVLRRKIDQIRSALQAQS
jgi:hypothetical protein